MLFLILIHSWSSSPLVTLLSVSTGVPSQDLNSGQPNNFPTRYQLNFAAPQTYLHSTVNLVHIFFQISRDGRWELKFPAVDKEESHVAGSTAYR